MWHRHSCLCTRSHGNQSSTPKFTNYLSLFLSPLSFSLSLPSPSFPSPSFSPLSFPLFFFLCALRVLRGEIPFRSSAHTPTLPVSSTIKKSLHPKWNGNKKRRPVTSQAPLYYFNVNRTSLDHLLLGVCADGDQNVACPDYTPGIPTCQPRCLFQQPAPPFHDSLMTSPHTPPISRPSLRAERFAQSDLDALPFVGRSDALPFVHLAPMLSTRSANATISPQVLAR